MSSSLTMTPFAKAAASGVVLMLLPQTLASMSPRVRLATVRAIARSGSSYAPIALANVSISRRLHS